MAEDHDVSKPRLIRLVWAGPLTILASVGAVWLIRLAAVSILRPNAEFMPLTPGPPVFDTVVAVGVAIVVFARIWSDSLEPACEYRSLAAKVLIVSFAPAVALAVMHGFGGGWPEAFALRQPNPAERQCAGTQRDLPLAGGIPHHHAPERERTVSLGFVPVSTPSRNVRFSAR